MKRKASAVIVIIALIALAVLLRLQTIPQLATSIPAQYSLNESPDRQLSIMGVNKWNPNVQNLSDYDTDLEEIKARGFNNLRFLVPARYAVNGSEAAFASTVKKYYPSNIIPILFNGNDNRFDNLNISDAKKYIDIWVPLFPNVTAWEIINEPPDGKPDRYYAKIITLIAYLHNKTSAPVTIGFNNDMPEAFGKLVNHSDIISFHYYPALATAFGTALVLDDAGFRMLRLFPELIRLTIPYTQRMHNFPVRNQTVRQKT